MKKKFSDFKTDAEAEAFVETADLSEYDLSDMIPVRFELRRKDKSIGLRLPEKLLEFAGKAIGGGAQPRTAVRDAVSAVHSPCD